MIININLAQFAVINKKNITNININVAQCGVIYINIMNIIINVAAWFSQGTLYNIILQDSY